MNTYLLDPFDNSSLFDNKIFESPFSYLRDFLKEKNININTYDQGDIASAEKILCFNHNKNLLKKCMDLNVPTSRMVLFLWEPETVRPDQYKKRVWKYYSKIFTFRDDLLIIPKFYKLKYPQGQSLLEKMSAFRERNFLTLINANKYGYSKYELYSFRRRAIEFFENSNCEFDLYGYDWEKNTLLNHKKNLLRHFINALTSGKSKTFLKDIIKSLTRYKSYRGSIDDKYKILRKYKFCICIENDRSSGWITEKIFDCLFSGTIPIYYGEPNIECYIPQSCFVDMRNFKEFKELKSFLMKMKEPKFKSMQKAGLDFIKSEKFAMWKPKNIFKEIVDNLIS